ncbi:hypothetical protein [Methanopyrus kandleri]|uniref:Uncharacterized protein n=1 Tax=Methanopyrus kandleri (strain AV19 / DSM 6324 / JCM 9639 / NBRC 100938) TaxID=190192 RepID=Q8TW71_METKA|nr:hypothetical protein [Methanopyrus kandleri]AAM02378.1 Uncharacterized protein MK1165 [Methanopyrus kandleri AV19]
MATIRFVVDGIVVEGNGGRLEFDPKTTLMKGDAASLAGFLVWLDGLFEAGVRLVRRMAEGVEPVVPEGAEPWVEPPLTLPVSGEYSRVELKGLIAGIVESTKDPWTVASRAARITEYLSDKGAVRILHGSDPYDVVAVGVLALKDGAVRGTLETVRSTVETIAEGARDLIREDEGRADEVISGIVGNVLLRLGYYAVNVRVTDRDGRVHIVRDPSTHADRVAVGVPLTGEVLYGTLVPAAEVGLRCLERRDWVVNAIIAERIRRLGLRTVSGSQVVTIDGETLRGDELEESATEILEEGDVERGSRLERPSEPSG